MRSVKIDIPPEISDDEARLLLAIRLLEDGRVSAGKAAEIAGYGRKAFMEVLAHRKVTLVDYPASELEEDRKNA